MLTLLLLPVVVGAADRPKIELPEGPAAAACARIPADTTPAALPAVSADAWTSPATWRRFTELLASEAQAPSPDPARRAELALLALSQHRYEDAWARFAECASSPATLAALRPHFLPGAPIPRSAEGDLEDGAVLRPALPPRLGSTPPPPRGSVQRRAMRIEGLKIGAAVLALRVSIVGEGVEIEVAHLSGGAAKLAIAIPPDPEFAYADEYVDWFRQEQKGVPHEVVVSPGDEPHTLYARFEPRPPAWPTAVPDRLPEQVAHGSIRLVSGTTPEDRALVQAVAECLARGPLHLAARQVDPGSPAEEAIGLRIDLADAAERPRKLAWIAGAIERRALEPRRSGPR